MGKGIFYKLKVGEICSLDKLKVGMRGLVQSINIENKLIRRRLFDMGITKGVCVKVQKIAPLGDPVSFEIRGYELSLRQDELRQIEVRVIKWELR